MSNVGICLAGNVDFDLNKFSKDNNITKWIAADGGYDTLISYNITPDLLIGDLDSIKDVNSTIETIKTNVMKDNTDGKDALEYVKASFNYDTIYLVGIIASERLEHFWANIKMIEDNVIGHTKYNIIYTLKPGVHTIKNDQYDYISFFAKRDISSLTIKDSLYEIENYKLDVNNTVGISNEFKDNKNIISSVCRDADNPASNSFKL